MKPFPHLLSYNNTNLGEKLVQVIRWIKCNQQNVPETSMYNTVTNVFASNWMHVNNLASCTTHCKYDAKSFLISRQEQQQELQQRTLFILKRSKEF